MRNYDAGRPYKWTAQPADYTLFAICNASYYGGGFCPAPNSKLDDGLLDYCIVDAINVAKALPLIPKYSAGTATPEVSPYIHMGYLYILECYLNQMMLQLLLLVFLLQINYLLALLHLD